MTWSEKREKRALIEAELSPALGELGARTHYLLFWDIAPQSCPASRWNSDALRNLSRAPETIFASSTSDKVEAR
jgi:hypothetical protein